MPVLFWNVVCNKNLLIISKKSWFNLCIRRALWLLSSSFMQICLIVSEKIKAKKQETTVADPTTVKSDAKKSTHSISASFPHGNAVKYSPGLVQWPNCCEKTGAFDTGVQPRTLETVQELPEDPLPVGPAKAFLSPPCISDSESDMEIDKTVIHMTPTKQVLESGCDSPNCRTVQIVAGDNLDRLF